MAQPAILLTAQQAAEVNAISDSANTVSTPEFKALQSNEAKQAAAVARFASAPPQTYNNQLMNSPVVEQYAKAAAVENKEVVQGVGAEEIARIKKVMPDIGQLGNDIKSGKFVVASDKGAEIISLIRSLALRNGTERQTILRKLQNYSDRGYPEAVNFMGVIFEYGLFGAKKDLNRALAFYTVAAKRRYQPAIYNLANSAFYGKNGHPQLQEADRLIAQAYSLGNEASFRVCGLGAFMKYREGNQNEALSFGRSCYSALANLPNAAYGNQNSIAERIKMLRDTIATGADDGFNVLEQIARPTSGNKDYMFCKYRLINQIRFTGKFEKLPEMAKDCYQKTTRDLNSRDEKMNAQIALVGINGFVTNEINSLQLLRKTNHYHYSWSVPYLPFGQGEVDLFEPIMTKEIQ